MDILNRFALGTVATVLGCWTLHPLAASAETSPATIIHADPDRACSGQAATLSWSPPAGVAGVTGYRITQMVTTPSTPETYTTDVDAGRTSLPFTVPFGLSTFQIRARTATGVSDDPYTSASIMGNQQPSAMAWDSSGADVGDSTATVPFRWFGPLTWSTTGGRLPVTLQVTAPVGVSIETSIPQGASGAAPRFTGLLNGAATTFTAVTSNACGSSAGMTSPRYVPGVAPAWTQASPQLTVARNKPYRYQFAASGSPAPTYRLVSAPSWLGVGPGGLVTGTPPKGTVSFSYSVTASNGVGIGSNPTDAPAGPFKVVVRKR